jgi:hypothetical protein
LFGEIKQSYMVSTWDILFTPSAVRVGLACLAFQCVWYIVLAGKVLGEGPWSKMPGFTAHQIVVVPVLLYLTFEGLREWTFFRDKSTATERILGEQHGHLCEFVIGMMLFWDIPTGLLTPSLRESAMVMHHIGMFATASIALGALSSGKPIMGYYAPFFFGLIELSSIPLILVDLFHPKHKAWFAYLTSDSAPALLIRLNEIARLVFAMCFLVMRTLYFPYVTIAGVLPDVWTVTKLPSEQRNYVPKLPLYAIAASNVLFSVLQMYWGALIVRQIFKLIFGANKEKKN